MSAGTGPLPAAPVLVGTEAVLYREGELRKGGGVGAVAFLDFDQELLAPRFRAGEEALALLARASRLVGGRQPAGKVLVQTRAPSHPVIEAALLADPGRLAASEEAVRQALRLPPFSALAILSGPGARELASALRGGFTGDLPADLPADLPGDRVELGGVSAGDLSGEPVELSKLGDDRWVVRRQPTAVSPTRSQRPASPANGYGSTSTPSGSSSGFIPIGTRSRPGVRAAVRPGTVATRLAALRRRQRRGPAIQEGTRREGGTDLTFHGGDAGSAVIELKAILGQTLGPQE